MLSYFLRSSKQTVLLSAAGLIALIALADWRIDVNIPLGFLYLFPMLLVGTTLNRWQIAGVAAVCTVLTEAFDSLDWLLESGVPRDILTFAAFLGMGIFVYDIVRNRRIAILHLNQIEGESEARREAEEQLKVLVESSPAAIFTTNSEGCVLLANDAAHRLFALGPGDLIGKSISGYFPSLVNVFATCENNQHFRTVMQCAGRREDGEVFLADIWFSTYRTSAGSRLAAMVADISEDLRTREESSLHQLLAGSRILVGAVSHEVRNVCGSIAMVHENLARSGALAQNKDFEALGTLVLALEKIAAMDLRQTADQPASIDLRSVLEELRIIIEHSLHEHDIEVKWNFKPLLPVVWADRHSLLQVFLNLTENSKRAMMNQERRELIISVEADSDPVIVRFRDTGHGVKNPDLLFRPFQQGAHATGLGLYLSRAFMRSFRGNLRYESESIGSSFIVELAPVIPFNSTEEYEAKDSNFGSRRSQPIS